MSFEIRLIKKDGNSDSVTITHLAYTIGTNSSGEGRIETNELIDFDVIGIDYAGRRLWVTNWKHCSIGYKFDITGYTNVEKMFDDLLDEKSIEIHKRIRK